MALVTLEEAKVALRVDSADEDDFINSLLDSGEKYCADVARLSDEAWAEIIAEPTEGDTRELKGKRAALHDALLYYVSYRFEHREEADMSGMALDLRSLLCFVREGVF